MEGGVPRFVFTARNLGARNEIVIGWGGQGMMRFDQDCVAFSATGQIDRVPSPYRGTAPFKYVESCSGANCNPV